MVTQTGDREKQTEAIQENRIAKPLAVALIALALGLAVDVLFFGHPLGVNFLLWALLAAGALLLSAAVEGVTPSRRELLLLVPILGLAFLTFLRLEPMTVFLCIVLTLAGFALWVRTFRADRLLSFGWLDTLAALIWVPIEAWLRPWPTMGAAWQAAVGERGAKSRTLAALRGVLLALPILAVFIALLASSDLIFGDFVENALAWLDLEMFFEYAGRLILVLLSAIFFLGALVAALRDPGDRALIGEDKPILTPFLGFIETVVILGAVDLLFLAFVAVQFAYLFGGEANISAAGYTYAEYARRGFGELVLVAFLSMGLIMALGYWGRRAGRGQKWWFNALSTVLAALLGLMLVSAMRRLALYEQAYGFSRLRAYAHVFIIWLAILLLAFLVLLYRDRLRRFAVVCLLGAVGFTVSLALLNVDAFIATRNIERYWESGEIDIYYLAFLSGDAVPALTMLAESNDPEILGVLLPQLACRREWMEIRKAENSWPSSHLSYQRAYQVLSEMEALDAYAVAKSAGMLAAEGPTGETTCMMWIP